MDSIKGSVSYPFPGENIVKIAEVFFFFKVPHYNCWTLHLRSKENLSQKLLGSSTGPHCPESCYMSGPKHVIDNGNGPMLDWLQMNSDKPPKSGNVAETASPEELDCG